MELGASSVCSAYLRQYDHLSSFPAGVADAAAGPDVRGGDSDSDRGGAQETTTTRLAPQRRKHSTGTGGCAGLRRRCYAVLKQQRTRLYILRRCVNMLLCWHEHDLSD